MKKFLLVLVGLLMYSCDQADPVTYFGGEIVNPKDDYVYLFYEEVQLDSASLDDQNRFHFSLNNPEEGVYKFFHGREYQYILLEAQDSLMLRLNTMEFDESLIFSGIGSEKNNFMIDMFLLKEDEKNLVDNFYKASPEIFVKKLDSMRAMKVVEYEELLSETDLSPLAKHVTKATIDFPYYTNKEYYTDMHKYWLGLKEKPELPESFYNHRMQVDINDKSLAHLEAYSNYVNAYLDRLTKDNCRGACQIGGKWSPYHYGTHKLHLVDSLISLGNLRSKLFETTAFKYFQYDHQEETNKKFITLYKKLTSGNSSADIDMVYQAVNNLRKGATFPVLELYDKKGEKHRLDSSWYDQKTVFYTWHSDRKMLAREKIQHMTEMASKYPEFQFIGINLDPDHQTWLNTMNELGVSDKNQLRAPDMEYIVKRFAYLRLNRMVVVDKDGKVIEGFGNIYNFAPIEYNKVASKLTESLPEL
ncbi:TlpA family protein disulfide reductase [Robertkochia flava]|uniref:TlpA family protein disulfide reductase n=1 Tax=Robertkochia flava TaxID=3447986 RepID=UPI001CC9D9D8|nr:hypothetical protein [Robertkochia marina]